MNKFAIALLTAMLAGPAMAREGPFRLVDFSVGDWRLGHSVKRVIEEQPELSKLKLGTTVKDKVVTLFGDVPTEELSRLAETTLKTVPGVASVVNECEIRKPDDTTAKDIAKEVETRLKQAKPALARTTAESREVQKPPVSLGEPEMDAESAPRQTARSLERLRDEARSLGLTIDLRKGDAVLSGRVEKLGDAWMIAEKLAELPEVDRVVFGQVKKR